MLQGTLKMMYSEYYSSTTAQRSLASTWQASHVRQGIAARSAEGTDT